ncbi:M14 family metallopeptidase [Sabulibacter ruber]|uniref:M14 family metallopeptidase n=1 Tax=Sabulibacter ruber TaxID=2811901 RepID=UPI001A964338|nr:M14 family metallopeptidase [Sabulibacter ruber]
MFLPLLTLIGGLLSAGPAAPDWRTPYEKSNRNQTATYYECIDYYQRLDEAYHEIKMTPVGMTDVGKPLHTVVVSTDGDFDPESIHRKGKTVLLVQNGIHPGEPEGIDATMMLTRDLVQNKKLRKQLDNVVLVIIPIYNVGGALNRNSHTRTNQNGPESYGFRGNARNLDLNRDFIKEDSKNAKTFATIFRTWDPEVFVDNHTSNGADYQYTMTLIPTQHNKLGGALGTLLKQQMIPALYKGMEKRKWPLVPYVNSRGETPETGIFGFADLPRYASGYTTLFQTLGFIPETHMLKSFDKRVASTYDLMLEFLGYVAQNGKTIQAARQQDRAALLTQQEFVLNWEPDTTQVETINFKGFEANYKASEVSGLERLYYDRKAPFTRPVKFFDTFRPTLTVSKPVAYIIPQAWTEVIDRLQQNQVELKRLSKDTVLTPETYYITDYKTGQRPYEGHYLHTDVQVRKTQQPIQYFAGDYVVYLNQVSNRFLVETLEPQAPDSYFAWNFFDSMLGQKEHFSAYVFEDLAAEYLKKDPKLKAALEEAKAKDPSLAKSAQAQLNFVYRNTPHYENTHLRYPVARWTGGALPIL